MAKAMGMPMDMPRMLGLMFTRPENKAGTYIVGHRTRPAKAQAGRS
jgi:hypothetical protein